MRRSEALPWTPTSHEGLRAVSRCLVADGYPVVSSLKWQWIKSKDPGERRRIANVIECAVLSTMLEWI